jgi:hypothetical protein
MHYSKGIKTFKTDDLTPASNAQENTIQSLQQG